MRSDPLRTRRRDDQAVSPVIAVILMVAITVVLSATVYVWISSFQASADAGAKAVTLQSGGPTTADGFGSYYKELIVASATAGLSYADFVVTIEGAPLTAELDAACAPAATERWSACAGVAVRGPDHMVAAGDVLTLRLSSDPDDAEMRLLDPVSNSVMLTTRLS